MRRSARIEWGNEEAFDGVPLRTLLARQDVGAIFRFLREHGHSWASVATLTQLQPSRVSEIASGRRVVTEYRVLERICVGLRIPRQYMGLGFDELAVQHRVTGRADRGVAAEVDSRDLLGVVASITVGAIPREVHRWLPRPQVVAVPGRLTDSDIDTVLKITALHRRLDAVAGGGSCLSSAVGYATWASQLLQVPAISDTLAARLRSALADLHNLIGWLAHDLGQHDVARRHLVQSLILARQADALPLLANGLYRLGRISLHRGEPADALHLFGLGQLAAQQAGCHASVAILHANTAWAYAQLGRDSLAVGSLARAATERALAEPDATPAWARFALAAADADGIAAVVYTTLARHDGQRHYAHRAAEHAHRAVALRSARQERRSYIFDLISVATASILIGDPAAAGRYGGEAVDLVTEGMRSARVVDRLETLWQLAAPAAATHPELEHLGARLRELDPAHV